jgi:copper resistance protein C
VEEVEAVTRSGRRIAALIWLSVVWVLLASSPALAHARLLEASPPGGATLEKVPEQVRLRFDEPVRAEFDPIEVYDAQGDRVDRDDGRLAAPEVVVVGLRELGEGSYRVEWRVTSADGDPVNGTYRFSIASSAVEGRAERNTAESSGGGEESGSSSDVVLYVGLGAVALVLVGVVMLRRR